MVFSVFGCKIKIEFLFFIILSFALLLKAQNIIYLLLFSSLHEAGHIVSLMVFGEKPDMITLSYYGIGIKHSAKLNRSSEAVFLISGLTVNLLLAILGIQKQINLCLFFINALPVVPLDGGRALALFLNNKVMNTVSALALLILIAHSVFTLNIYLLSISAYLLISAVHREFNYD